MTADRDLEYLERLSVAAATGWLPPDVARWAVARVIETIPAVRREAQRVRLIRVAGRVLGGSARSQATEISAIAAGLRAAWGYYGNMPAERGTVPGLVHQAMLLDPDMGISVRQLLRVLGRCDTEPVA